MPVEKTQRNSITKTCNQPINRSNRAITSPAGTADAMEVLTNVNLSLDEMRRVVNKEGGCIAWGGAMKLSPADDIIIRVEKALDVDSEERARWAAK